MKKNIKRVCIYSNYKKESQRVAKLLRKKLLERGYLIDRSHFDLAIAVGGDGTFIKMVHATKFQSDVYYAGIHTGTLGFLQEIDPKEIDLFLDKLQSHELLEEQISIQRTKIEGIRPVVLHSLNEIVIRQMDLKTLSLKISIHNQFLEEFVGDGVLIATTVGSTAYNLSVHGAIVDSSLHTLQLTPLSPLNNKAYRNLLNSLIVPEHKTITIMPSGTTQDKNADLMVVVDGTVKKYHNVRRIQTTVDKRRITYLKLPHHSFYHKVHDKFLGDNK